MRFKEYMESLDLSYLDSSKIGERYYEFEFDGEQYQLYFDPHNLYVDKSIHGVQITFKGPNGCMPTGKSKFRAPKLYAKMISAVIAYVEKYQPKCLRFSGATAGMEFIYKRFADKFASDEPGKPSNRVFIRINDQEWVRKDAYENTDEISKEKIAGEIEAWLPYEKQFFDSRKAKLDYKRENRRKYQNYIGGFINTNGHWYLIGDFGDFGIFEVYDKDFYRLRIYDSDLPNSTLLLPSQLNLVPKNVLKQFADTINSPNFKTYRINVPSMDTILQLVNNEI